MLQEQLLQIFESAISEGDGLLVGGSVDPEASILGLDCVDQVRQQLLVFAEEFGSSGDGDGGSRRCHCQAAWSIGSNRYEVPRGQ
jgi:hypothetical protein